MHNEVDKFLLSHKAEIADDGFSDRVMRLLPARAEQKKSLERLWQGICILVTIILISFTNVLEVVLTDLKAFIVTLPLESDLTQWFYILGVPILAFWLSTACLAHVSIKFE